MERPRPHRLVPLLSGAALAIILDTGIEMVRAEDPRPDERAIRAEPAPTRPIVVSREDASAVEEPIRAPEPKPSPPRRRPETPMPNPREVESTLMRALARRGLALDDLDRVPSLKNAVAKLKTAQKGTDGRDVDAALTTLLAAIPNAELTHDLLMKKLGKVNTVLIQSEPSIAKDRFQVLQSRYLDAKLELPRLSTDELVPFAVKLSKLSQEIQDAKSR